MNTKSLFIAILVLVIAILPPNWQTWTEQALNHPYALHAVWLIVLAVSPFVIHKAYDEH
ncbi:hypothetical protein [Salinibius halmophilus]|uniref:hypothetical protein n=1 Tax=Salinibius halmophilus TaxID=1853216 RepID=UPI0013146582|nr:hypothetical protein [Salinibius halmophilus]